MKKISVCLCLLMCVFIMAACGGGGESTAGSDNPSATNAGAANTDTTPSSAQDTANPRSAAATTPDTADPGSAAATTPDTTDPSASAAAPATADSDDPPPPTDGATDSETTAAPGGDFDQDPMPGQEQFHVETYIEEGTAAVEYVFVTGLPEESIQIKLNKNLEEFFLYGIRNSGHDGIYFHGVASYHVVGGRFLSVVSNVDAYNDEFPVNGSDGPAYRNKSAFTFDLTTGERADELVFGGAAYLMGMGNAYDWFSQVYPDADNAEAKSWFHDYVQSNDFIGTYYLTELNLGIYFAYFEDDGRHDYIVFEAPYSKIGVMLAGPLADALEQR